MKHIFLSFILISIFTIRGGNDSSQITKNDINQIKQEIKEAFAEVNLSSFIELDRDGPRLTLAFKGYLCNPEKAPTFNKTLFMLQEHEELQPEIELIVNDAIFSCLIKKRIEQNKESKR